MQKKAGKIGYIFLSLILIHNLSADTRLPGPFPIMAAGSSHTLLIKPDGSLYSWGSNASGELSDGTYSRRLNPVNTGYNFFVQVAAGDSFSVGIADYGGLMSWGKNNKGQLGQSYLDHNFPGTIGDGDWWRFVTAGFDHALAIQYDGALYAWGNNADGELGLGANAGATKSFPARVGIENNWIKAAAGKGFTIALKADGSLWSWGKNNFSQLGQGNTNSTYNIPTLIGPSTDHWIDIAAGGSHVLAIKDDGTLWGWGLNDSGQVGDNKQPVNQTKPFKISTEIWRAISAGDKHSLGIKANGTLYAWGSNLSGALGFGNSSILKKTPNKLGTDNDWQYISAGKGFTLAIKSNGNLSAWGNNSSGQLGIGNTTSPQYTKVTPWKTSTNDLWATNLKPGVLIGADYQAMDIRSNGQLESWGANTSGQLGTGSTDALKTHNVPAVHVAGNTWMQGTGGERQSLAIQSDGSLWAWGTNSAGEMGIAAPFSYTPVKVNNDLNWRKVYANYGHTLALKANGELWGWGENGNYQLGDGTTNTHTTPILIGFGKKWVAIATGQQQSLGITSDGKLWAWGRGGGVDLTTPTQVGTESDWVTIEGSATTSIVVKANGDLYQYGNFLTYFLSQANLVTTTSFSNLVSTPGGVILGWGSGGGDIPTGDSFGSDFPLFTQYPPVRSMAGCAFTSMVLKNNGVRYSSGNGEYFAEGQGSNPAPAGNTGVMPGKIW